MDNSMQMEMERLKPLLEKEISIHRTQIKALYKKLDNKFHLFGADLPIEFRYDTEVLGSYTPGSEEENEHFSFSLFFIGYALKRPMSKEDRMDLYKHEYAHYMEKYVDIPKEYRDQSGKHGLAWKYCCSLIGAAPTAGYRAGEAKEKHDYDKALKKKDIASPITPMVDQFRREQEYQQAKNREIQFKVGDLARHPKYGEGIVENIEQLQGSVRLTIRFGEEVKKIDQKWLIRQAYSAAR